MGITSISGELENGLMLRTATLAASLFCLAATALALVLPGGKDAASETEGQCLSMARDIKLYRAVEVRRSIELLDLLRSGQLQLAITTVEQQQLGPAIADLQMKTDEIDLTGNSTITISLIAARNYFTEFPRTPSDAPGLESLIQEALAQVDGQARWSSPENSDVDVERRLRALHP